MFHDLPTRTRHKKASASNATLTPGVARLGDLPHVSAFESISSWVSWMDELGSHRVRAGHVGRERSLAPELLCWWRPNSEHDLFWLQSLQARSVASSPARTWDRVQRPRHGGLGQYCCSPTPELHVAMLQQRCIERQVFVSSAISRGGHGALRPITRSAARILTAWAVAGWLPPSSSPTGTSGRGSSLGGFAELAAPPFSMGATCCEPDLPVQR